MARTEFDPVDHYLCSLLPAESAFALKAKAEARRLQKDRISLSLPEAHLLCFFIKQQACARFIELGTLTGYSGLKILETLPAHGHLWTFELGEDQARFASQIFDEAGFKNRYTILVGRAEEKLAEISSAGPFDGIFIDANKSSYPFYLDWSATHLKSGGLLLADNTLLKGVTEVDDGHTEKMIRELRVFNQRLLNHPQFHSAMIPTSQGLAIAIKR